MIALVSHYTHDLISLSPPAGGAAAPLAAAVQLHMPPQQQAQAQAVAPPNSPFSFGDTPALEALSVGAGHNNQHDLSADSRSYSAPSAAPGPTATCAHPKPLNLKDPEGIP